MEGDEPEFPRRSSLVRGDKTVPSGALIGERIFPKEGGGGHGSQPVIGYWQRVVSGLLLSVVESADEFGDKGIFCSPKMHVGEHDNDVGTLKPTIVC